MGKDRLTSVELKAKIQEAHSRAGGDIHRTPLEYSPDLSRMTGAEVYLKWECEQRTGSFKFRGALNKIRSLSADEKRRGVVSASTGNHGLGISLAAEMEGVGLTLVLPQNVAFAKRQRLDKGQADIITYGASCEKAEIRARRLAGETGRTYVSPYNDQEIIAGQGTIGPEILQDLPDVQAVIVPVGGGGLIAGIAAWLKEAGRPVDVYGAEPLNSAVMAASLAAGKIVEISETETIADAVAGGLEPGCITFPLCSALLNGILVVEESFIKKAMRLIHEHHRRTAEGAGALPLAALLKDPDRMAGRKVVLVVSGGNVTREVFAEALRR